MTPFFSATNHFIDSPVVLVGEYEIRPDHTIKIIFGAARCSKTDTYKQRIGKAIASKRFKEAPYTIIEPVSSKDTDLIFNRVARWIAEYPRFIELNFKPKVSV